ncbi:MAG: 2-hydroxyacyl-CoA dehydratase, partial [Ignavibacteria bacterium]
EKAKIEYIKHWAEEFRIDGILFHDAKTCFNNSNSRFGMPLIMKNILNIPVMVIEGDLNDMRFYSEGQNISKMETFLEQIETRKMYS